MFEALKGVVAPSRDELMKPADQALVMACSWVIDSDDSYAMAGEELRAIKAKAKALEEKRTSLTVPLNQVLRGINALFADPADRLAQAEKALKKGMIAYQDRLEAERREAEAAARKAAAEEAAKMVIPQAPDTSEAAAMEQAQRAIVAACGIPPAPAPIKLAGVSKVKVTLKGKVVDKAALLAHIAQAPAFMDLVDINEGRLNQLVKALGDKLLLPGVELVEEKSIAARAA